MQSSGIPLIIYLTDLHLLNLHFPEMNQEQDIMKYISYATLVNLGLEYFAHAFHLNISFSTSLLG